jgi:hypothetical protein
MMPADQGIVKTPSSSTVNWSCSHALIIRVASKPRIGSRQAAVSSLAALLLFLRGFVAEQSVALHYVESWAMRRAVHVNHGKRPDLDAHGVNHQRAAFVVADRISLPARRHVRRMGLVQAYVADLVIVGVENREFVRLLEHLHSNIPKNERYPTGQDWLAGVG